MESRIDAGQHYIGVNGLRWDCVLWQHTFYLLQGLSMELLEVVEMWSCVGDNERNMVARLNNDSLFPLQC